jgi:hypothetical protein
VVGPALPLSSTFITPSKHPKRQILVGANGRGKSFSLGLILTLPSKQCRCAVEAVDCVADGLWQFCSVSIVGSQTIPKRSSVKTTFLSPPFAEFGSGCWLVNRRVPCAGTWSKASRMQRETACPLSYSVRSSLQTTNRRVDEFSSASSTPFFLLKKKFFADLHFWQTTSSLAIFYFVSVDILQVLEISLALLRPCAS